MTDIEPRRLKERLYDALKALPLVTSVDEVRRGGLLITTKLKSNNDYPYTHILLDYWFPLGAVLHDDGKTFGSYNHTLFELAYDPLYTNSLNNCVKRLLLKIYKEGGYI